MRLIGFALTLGLCLSSAPAMAEKKIPKKCSASKARPANPYGSILVVNKVEAEASSSQPATSPAIGGGNGDLPTEFLSVDPASIVRIDPFAPIEAEPLAGDASLPIVPPIASKTDGHASKLTAASIAPLPQFLSC